MKDVADLKDSSSVEITSHKEELASRVKYDENDRQVIREKLQTCIDPSNTASHLVNIVTGHICTDEVNVHNAIDLGKSQMKEYEASWPAGFHQPLKKKVRTMKENKKKTTTVAAEQFESGLMFARALALMNSRDIKVEYILSYELASVPTSMFDEITRNLRIAKSKSLLKNKLQVKQSARATGQPDAIVMDDCAILWVVHWPSKGSVQDLVTNVVKQITSKLKGSTRVHIIFYRYCEYSIKSGTRCSRKAQVSREHQLCLSSPLPPQDVALTVTKNKIQLIDMICDELVSSVALLNLSNSFVVTGKSPIPTEVCSGLQIIRPDLKTMHEEADVIIPNQVVYLESLGCCTIKVISDDTDVFVLLVHYYADKKLTSALVMEPTSQGRSSVNIGSTVAKHQSIALQLLLAHALTGCDTVASYFSIGKSTVVKTLEAGNRLNHLGNPMASLEDVLCESAAFVAACYGQKCQPHETMTDIRYKVWVSKTGRKSACLLPKLKVIPPTSQSFKENTKRAHFQACIWKAALDEEPPNLVPLKFG